MCITPTYSHGLAGAVFPNELLPCSDAHRPCTGSINQSLHRPLRTAAPASDATAPLTRGTAKGLQQATMESLMHHICDGERPSSWLVLRPPLSRPRATPCSTMSRISPNSPRTRSVCSGVFRAIKDGSDTPTHRFAETSTFALWTQNARVPVSVP